MSSSSNSSGNKTGGKVADDKYIPIAELNPDKIEVDTKPAPYKSMQNNYYINYGNRSCSIQMDWSCNEQGGIPRTHFKGKPNEYTATQDKCAFVQRTFNPNSKSDMVALKQMRAMDQRFGSKEFRKKQFGKDWETHVYCPMVRKKQVPKDAANQTEKWWHIKEAFATKFISEEEDKKIKKKMKKLKKKKDDSDSDDSDESDSDSDEDTKKKKSKKGKNSKDTSDEDESDSDSGSDSDSDSSNKKKEKEKDMKKVDPDFVVGDHNFSRENPEITTMFVMHEEDPKQKKKNGKPKSIKRKLDVKTVPEARNYLRFKAEFYEVIQLTHMWVKKSPNMQGFTEYGFKIKLQVVVVKPHTPGAVSRPPSPSMLVGSDDDDDEPTSNKRAPNADSEVDSDSGSDSDSDSEKKKSSGKKRLNSKETDAEDSEDDDDGPAKKGKEKARLNSTETDNEGSESDGSDSGSDSGGSSSDEDSNKRKPAAKKSPAKGRGRK
jgi:hypothetical protein